MNRLDPILEATRAEVARRQESVPEAVLERPADDGVRSFAEALGRPGLSVIAEHKRRSPSAGAIRDDLALDDVVKAYERGGAAALSILTDGPSFGGSLEDLRAARAATGLPALRKDFIVDPYQVYESFAAGADAILLIVAALAPERLRRAPRARRRELGLAALVEVHDERELDTALSLGARGDRNQQPRPDDARSRHRAAPSSCCRTSPASALVVSESGFTARGQLDELERAGVDGVLIGEALMRSPDVEAACRELALG